MTELQIFEPDGRAIPYVDEGNGPAVVLMPGRGLNVSYLGPLAGALAVEDFRVVRIGFRRPSPAAADTAAADSAVTMHDLAQDVVDVMDHVGLDHAWVGGHAFGGAVARTVSLDHHDRVNGVVLLGVDEPGETGDDAEHDAAPAPEHARDAEVEPMQRAARAATPDAAWSVLAPGVPALIIQGTQDRITPPENGDRLQASAPDRASIVRIEGGGHLFPATHVGETSWAIEDYLDWD